MARQAMGASPPQDQPSGQHTREGLQAPDGG